MSTLSALDAVPKASRRSLGFAYLCLVMFMLVYCARPEDWVPHLSAIPLAKITGTLMILAFLFSLGQVRGHFRRNYYI